MIVKCDCKNTFQDKKYGTGMRVFNAKLDKDGTNYRCSVCNKEKQVNN